MSISACTPIASSPNPTQQFATALGVIQTATTIAETSLSLPTAPPSSEKPTKSSHTLKQILTATPILPSPTIVQTHLTFHGALTGEVISNGTYTITVYVWNNPPPPTAGITPIPDTVPFQVCFTVPMKIALAGVSSTLTDHLGNKFDYGLAFSFQEVVNGSLVWIGCRWIEAPLEVSEFILSVEGFPQVVLFRIASSTPTP